ncbi:MAG: sugar phosphate isomerase/epimerase [Bacteroidales bacterium]|jgi:sugar phosphate isomerase/epimerase|nr:sugar phosphate isomerase/epimerase [Bacteroidales bacterium]
MKKFSRRAFMGISAAGMGSLFIASRIHHDFASAAPAGLVKMPIGFQVWTIREALIKDFPGTLKKMAGMGYESVEMCSPPGYETSGFGPLMKLKAREMKQIINDAGLEFTSTHYVMKELRENLGERIEFAIESGQKQMILSSFGLPREATADDWKKAADELNGIGRKAKDSGMQIGFHNHHGEFAMIDNKLIYELLLERFDPDFVKMQFQVAVISIGYKAADYFRKYPGRFISVHLADWSAEKKDSVSVGQGVVDWKELFSSVETGGVKNIFVEMDEVHFKPSADYLKTI